MFSIRSTRTSRLSILVTFVTTILLFYNSPRALQRRICQHRSPVSSYEVVARPYSADTGKRVEENTGEGSGTSLNFDGVSCQSVEKLHQLSREGINFIHIPKTGGTSIEDLFHQRWNISVGRFGTNYSVYPLQCSKWHCPPSTKVRNSFALVRDPVERLESEFWWGHSLFADSKNFSKSELGFNKWAEYVLSSELFRFKRDCHMLSQYAFAQQASVILPMRCMQEIQSTLVEMFDGFEARKQFNLVHKNFREANLTGVAQRFNHSELIHSYYAEDYKYLSNYF